MPLPQTNTINLPSPVAAGVSPAFDGAPPFDLAQGKLGRALPFVILNAGEKSLTVSPFPSATSPADLSTTPRSYDFHARASCR